MTPKKIIAKLANADDYLSRSFTIKDIDSLISNYVEVITAPYGTSSSYLYKEIGKYRRTFLAIGALHHEAETVVRKFVRVAAEWFPYKIMEQVEKKVRQFYKVEEIDLEKKQKIERAIKRKQKDTLRRFYDDCILSLLFPGNAHYYARGGNKLGDGAVQAQYGYIPSTPYYLIDCFIEKHPYLTQGTAFIDVGCGIADKTILVYMLQLPINAAGIEYDYINAKFARKAIDHFLPHYCRKCGAIIHREVVSKDEHWRRYKEECTGNCGAEANKYGTFDIKSKPFIVTGDAFEFDFSDFDRIYTYCPIHNIKLMGKLYQKIWSQLQEGAMWYEVYTYHHLYSVVKNTPFEEENRNWQDSDSRMFAIITKTKEDANGKQD